jgi:outer membrane protein assembly factor BamA
VEVRRRFGSIADPSSIVVIIVVDELASASRDPVSGPIGRILESGMFLPVLRHDEGYGFTYGGRFSFIGTLGPGSRVFVPLTWGGTREAALGAEWSVARGPVSRVTGAAGIERRVNPFYDLEDTRRRVQLRAERAFGPRLRVGASADSSRVAFGDRAARQWTTGVDAAVDTRREPLFPRNALHVTAAWNELHVEGRSVGRTSTTLAGYVGGVGSSVLALTGTMDGASAPLPPWEQLPLGGGSRLRGYGVGYRVGDQRATASAELRVPLTSPLGAGRFGLRAFVDGGATWAHGERPSGARWDRGIGGGLFLTAAVLSAHLDVAWPERGSARLHFGGAVSLP